jgi:hypothetical protein
VASDGAGGTLIEASGGEAVARFAQAAAGFAAPSAGFASIARTTSAAEMPLLHAVGSGGAGHG